MPIEQLLRSYGGRYSELCRQKKSKIAELRRPGPESFQSGDTLQPGMCLCANGSFVDAEEETLSAVGASFDLVDDFDAEAPVRSGVFGFNLTTGQLEHRYMADEPVNENITPTTEVIVDDVIHYVGQGPPPETVPGHFAENLAPFLGKTIVMTAPLN